MSKVVAYNEPAGGVAVMAFPAHAAGVEIDDDGCVCYTPPSGGTVRLALPEGAKGAVVLDADSLPKDRDDREKWKLSRGKVVVGKG